MKPIYKAMIEFTVYEDDYEQGELGSSVNYWEETYTASTTGELRSKVLEATYSNKNELDDEQMNEYDWATEYHTSYLTNELNEGVASAQEIEDWKLGRVKLYAVNCHILVTKVTEEKAVL